MRFGKSVALAMAVVAALTTPSLKAAEEEPRPEIRDFDFATMEALGQAMYVQDQLAWVAADVANSERGERTLQAEGMRGWVTVMEESRSIVRFVRMNDDTPEALYDVVFMEGETPQLYSPATPVLTPEELAQYNARMLALGNMEDTCSERYNTIALRDPESSNWLVWAIAATTEPDVMVVGGHYRFTIAEDGSAIVRTDRLFAGCLNLSRPQATAGGQGFLSVGHVISLTPLETHVFASMSWPEQFYVGTNDGHAWRLEDGHISSVNVTSDGVDGASARFLLGQTEMCSAILRDTSRAEGGYFPTEPGLKIILSSENTDEVPFTVPNGFELVGFSCVRYDVVPAPNDYKLLRAGIALSIGDAGEGHPDRLVNYSYENGAFGARVINGEALDAETQARIDARFAQFREAMTGAP